MNQLLLTQYITGACSDAERQAVKAWAEASPEHAAELRRLQRLWEASGAPPDYVPDTNMAWERLQQAIAEPAASPEAISRSLWPRLMRIAAVVALVSVASWFIFEKGISKNQDRWTVYATTDEVKTLSLGDGSVVTLNRNSKLEVSPNFDNQRRTRLQGEAFFEVQKQEGKQFTVGLGQSDIMVLGTRFNASSSSGAERVVVEEGKVAFRLARANSDSLHLSANQSAGYVEKKLMRLPAPDPNEMAWRTQIINFSEQPMTYVEKTVEACYGKEIFVPDELATCKITAKFDQNSLEEVMEVIAIALNAEFKKSDNGWRLRGGSCD